MVAGVAGQPGPEARRQALEAAGLIHPHPEAVAALLFKRNETFFDATDKVQVKYEMLRAHVVDGTEVTLAAATHGYSHELRTPLATVRGYVDSALARVDGVLPELQGDLETIDREIERLQQLIDDLFALAQTELGKLTLRLEPTDVGAVVQQVVSTAAPLAWRKRRVEVLADVGSGLPPAIADRHRLEQVLSNLLGNAVRHTPQAGWLL
jgi:signal transduction histidine kinase